MSRLVAPAFVLVVVSSGAVFGQGTVPAPQSASRVPTAAERLAGALAADPLTAPYRIRILERKGRLVLQGKVGSTVAHDAAVRIGIEMRLPITDELVTDTREAARAATVSDGPAQLMPGAAVRSNRTFVYPEPLFGRVDEPFAGMEPPLLTYPPEWGAVVGRRGYDAKLAALAGATAQPPLPRNTVEAAIDPRGVALLRGNVPTASDRDQVAQELSQAPGVSAVINRITVAEPPAPGRRPPVSDTPPPPPTPARTAARPARADPATRPVAVEPARPSALQARVNQSLQRVPELRGVGVEAAEVAPGMIRLKGRVAGPKEAMLAYRSVQKTPGVAAVGDALEFPAPDASKRNPLTIDVDPADVEPFLAARIARELGDVGRVVRAAVSGDRLDLQVDLERAEDRARVEAILRSAPLLRGFKVDAAFKSRG